MAKIFVTYPNSGGSGSGVDSVFGRTGDVVAVAGDYDAAEVDYGAGTVEDALDELYGEIVPAVQTYADLPAAGSLPADSRRCVLTATGAWYTFNYHSSGIYKTDGIATWTFVGTVTLQAEVIYFNPAGTTLTATDVQEGMEQLDINTIAYALALG